LAQITNQTWELRIAGGGPEANRLLTLRDQLGIRDRVAFLGCLPNPEVIRAIQSSDVLVLPSRGDGWGAVINEALCAGVPVLCSDRCGARALIQTPIQGEVFRSDCTKDLHAALVRWTRTPLGDGHRARLALWARSLTGQSGAAYLTRILRHIYEAGPLPRPPWCEV
jgi:glycosyltransferase involved in cell wall biosynthesis